MTGVRAVQTRSPVNSSRGRAVEEPHAEAVVASQPAAPQSAPRRSAPVPGAAVSHAEAVGTSVVGVPDPPS